MLDSELNDRSFLILILTTVGKDAELTEVVLNRAGISCLICRDIHELALQMASGAGAILVPEDRIHESNGRLEEWLKNQPPWSDLPVLLLAKPGADSAALANAMDALGNVTVLERPMRISALVSAVQTALRARQRQYQVREHLLAQEKASADLKLADQRKDEFLAILAHELRNPLAPICSALELLRMKGMAEDQSEQLRQVIERQVGNMVRLVDDLLEVSRITRGNVELRTEPVEMQAVLASAIETSRPLIDQRDHDLELSIPAEPIIVDGDAVRLGQIFANLLNNAAKYTEVRGRISLTVVTRNDEVEVSVRDTGSGISEAMLPEVFEMFRQVDRNSDRTQGGLGIGLTLVRSLVELHGGQVSAHSDGLGKGSRFTVVLPLSSLRTSAGANGHVDLHGNNHRFLVVDDNQDAATMLGMLLEIVGGEVRLAYSGVEALAMLDDYTPTTILLDIGMPLMDGREVARRIREMPQFTQTTLIALSGWGQEEDRRLSELAGFDHHLVKPVDLGSLEAILSKRA